MAGGGVSACRQQAQMKRHEEKRGEKMKKKMSARSGVTMAHRQIFRLSIHRSSWRKLASCS
jgi:hypothetical protein